jgi:hypothetical protein
MIRKLPSFTAIALSAGLAAACSSASIPAGVDDDAGSSKDTGTGRDTGAADSGPGDSGPHADSGPVTDLQWYTTCGYPVCPEVPDASATDSGACPTVGSSCATKGEMCGTPDDANCGSVLVCDDHDPKGAGGDACPVSSRTFKDGVQYVGDAELQALHDEALRMKLATYNYKSKVADPGPKHLGFIIEDNPRSLSVDAMHNRVDLYGYVSMVVASMQVQEKEIAALRSELDATKRRAAACGQR